MINDPYEISALLQAAIGTQVRLVDCRVVKSQQDYYVLFARLNHPTMDVVIKLAGPEARRASQFDRTAHIHQLVAQTTKLPLAEIIATDISFQKWPWRYIIQAYVPGTEWATLRGIMKQSELDDAYRQIGEAIGQLHQISFPAFGEIDRNGHVTCSDLTYLPALRKHAVKIIQSSRMQKAFLVALEQRASWFDGVGESRLCHEDLHGYNILFARHSGEWRLAAILDFDKVWAGHVETDLARLELWRGMTSPAFWEAYQMFRPSIDGYMYRRPIYQLLWCLEYAQATPEHLADTQQICLELGIPVIERFD